MSDDLPARASLTTEERRWLHDKYERLAAEEGQLSGSRTAYFATIGAVLLTGLVVLFANLLSHPIELALGATLLGGLGVLISIVWVLLLHRTNDAQAMWREAALRLEEIAPPVAPGLGSRVTLRSGATIPVDLAGPYHMHQARFSPANPISALDRVNPSRLTETMPLSLLVIWAAVLVVVWSWYLSTL
ncbi:MAG: hypothetical protein L3K10_06410 [Thermoplasmata archaeon]|nr:hypothetical protein [Thermoplasmata archaeon]